MTAVNGVYLNGAPTFGFLADQPNIITFGAAPSAGTVITADFKFGYACRFTEDVADFEEFMSKLSGVKTLAFQSVRDIVPFEITALRTIVIQFPPWRRRLSEFCAPPDWNNNYNRVIAIGGGGGGGYGAGAIGGGGGAFTYRDNVHSDVGQCVPIDVGDWAGPPGPAAAANGHPGCPDLLPQPRRSQLRLRRLRRRGCIPAAAPCSTAPAA